MKKKNLMKRILASALVCLSLSSIIPEQAKALTQGTFSTGGTGVNWIMGAREWPCFTITMLDEKFDSAIKPAANDANAAANISAYKGQFTEQYKKKLPDLANYQDWNYGRLYMMPKWLTSHSELYSAVQDVVTYNYSNGSEYAIGEDHSSQVMFKLDSPVSNMPAAVDQMRVKYHDYMKAHGNNLSSMSGIWDTSTTATLSYSDAYAAMCYLFQSDSGIEDRMGEILYDNYYKNDPIAAVSDDGIVWQAAASLTMSTILYAVAGGSHTEQAYYNSRTEEWLTDSNRAEKPLVFEVEPASVWVRQDGTHFLMNAIDMLDLYMAAYKSPEDTSLRAKWGSANDWDIYSLLERASMYIYNKYPGSKGDSSWTGAHAKYWDPQGSQTNMYSYGFSLPTGIYFEWSSGAGSTVAAAGSSSGYVKNITFYGEMHGFFLGYNLAATMVPATTGGQDIIAEGEPVITVSQDVPTIPEDPVIDLVSAFKDDEKEQFKQKYGATKPNFYMAAQITKTAGPQTVIEPLSGLSNDSNNFYDMSYDEVVQWMDGAINFQFQDKLSGTAIANDQAIVNKYKSVVWIKENNTSVAWGAPLDARDGEAIKTYKRDPIAPHYTSSHTEFSEVKNNEPENEEFEAMAGTPTTRQLYYASGGSEFIVDLELKYVPNQTTTRNYRVNFSTAQCEKYDSPHVPNKDGDCTGGCHKEIVGGDSYSWSQSITYDYMKIVKAQVWKIEKSKVDGMSRITSAGDVLTATIKDGDPSAFWNVAKSDTAAGGRILYSYVPEMLDNPTWNLPTSTKCNGAWSVANQAVVAGYKAQTNTATVVSDFLILQTNAGDQSAMYFDQKSDTVTTPTNFTFTKTSEDAMWKANSNTASTWDVSHVAVSSYNGKYKSPDSKYKTRGSGGSVATAFDSSSYGQVMSRPSSPGNQMIMDTTFNPKVNNKNGLYTTGISKVFYKHIVNEGKASNVYFDMAEAGTLFGGTGLVYEAPYSPSHSKVNNIVLHDPVSSEKSMVIPLDSSRDQRTADTKPAVQVPKQDTTEYIDVLPTDYLNNIAFNGYARYKNSLGMPLGWSNWSSGSGVTYSRTTSNVITDNSESWSKEHDKYWDGIQYSFNVVNTQNVSSCFYQRINIEPGKTYTLEGDGKTTGGDVYIGPELYDKNNAGVGFANNYIETISGGITHCKSTFTAPANTKSMNIVIYQIGVGNLTADNIMLKCTSNAGKFTPNDARVLDWKTTKNPMYHSHAESGCTSTTVYDCGNQPLNVGGTMGYSITHGNGCSNQGETHLSTTSSPCSVCGHSCGGTIVPTLIGAPTAHVHTGACARHIAWSCGLQDTSIGRTTYDNCDNVLNAGGYSTFSITHGNGCSYDGETHASTTWPTCSVCGHTHSNDYYTTTTSSPTYHVHTASCIKVYSAELKTVEGWASASIQPPASPQSWEYNQIIKAPSPLKPVITPNGTFTPGNFINLDYPFQIYFPNIGDFYGTGALGIRKTTKDRGYGFEDNMSTTEWTKSKYVTFQFDVIFNNKMYRAGEKVWLDVNKDTFDFYCPLENKEARGAEVNFVAIAINNSTSTLDNDQTTNKLRYNSKLQAKHSSVKTYNIDVVGRIGNMTIQDTGDFRFANFFKKSYGNGEWLIPNIVPTVDISVQNFIVGDKKDVRGLAVSATTKYLNTFGTEPYKEQNPYAFPLSPTYNNIQALKRQPLRIGYPTFMDVDTLGNYIYGNVDILPYYYAMDLTDGSIQPVDIYMSVNSSYQLINRFSKVVSGSVNTNGIYDNKVFLNWSEESLRRNYIGNQANISNDASKYYTDNYTSVNTAGFSGSVSDTEVVPPYGKYYVLGNNNALALTTRARSFIGTADTYGVNYNPGTVVNNYDYTVHGQRWHYTITLPSTAVAVKAGKALISEGAGKTIVADSTHVILASVDIKAVGDTYALKHDVSNPNVSIETITSTGVVNSKSYDISSIPYQVVSVNSSEKTSKDDMTTSGTH